MNRRVDILGSVGVLLVALALGGGPAFAQSAPGEAPPDKRSIQEITVAPGEKTVVSIRIDGASDGAAVSSFALTDPDQVVVDIADATVATGATNVVDSSGLIQRVTVEMIDDEDGVVARLRFFLSKPVTHSTEVSGGEVRLEMVPNLAGYDPMARALENSNGSGAVAVNGNYAAADAADVNARLEGDKLSGPKAGRSGPGITTLDFQSLDTISRIVVGTQGNVDYTSSQPQDNLIVVDFQGAFLPESLTRVLDANEFISPVRMVRAYRTSGGARVAITLRTDTPYTVAKAEDGRINIDVVVPSYMQRDRQAAVQGGAGVSPSSSTGSISNAYQEEILIGSEGHTQDPRAAFGTGAGSLDPSSLLGMASGFLFDAADASSLPYQGRRISINLVNADIHSILRLISAVSRLNIVTSDEVEGTVTVMLTDVPWDQALAAILQAKGLGSQRFGNIIRVAPIETIKSEQQAALEAKTAREQLTETKLLVLPLNYTQASEMSAQVTPLLTERGSLQVDSRSNQLIIKDTPDQLAQIRELVRHLDKQTPQVLIEARVVEASSAYSKSLGIQWGGEVDASAATGFPLPFVFPNEVGVSGGLNPTGGGRIFYKPGQDNLLVDLGAQTGEAGSFAMHLGSVTGLLDLDARLGAMEAEGWGKVVSSPKITTLDNQAAHISQGQQIPYLSTSSSGTSVKFVTAALDLNVTPHITSDNKVFLNVTVSNNRADFGLLVNGSPAIQIKQAETQLLVADGDTTVLGGVFATEESYSQTRVPGLSHIPLIGYLFKNSNNLITRNELLVFITPHVVTRALDDQQQ